jgi:hypothetical protein
MSHANLGRNPIQLIVHADNPAVHIAVSDGHFTQVAEGLGQMEALLAPGLYSVTFKAGSLIHKTYIALEPGREPVTITAPALPFATPVPLQQTRTTHPIHEQQAASLSRQIAIDAGSGSQLFVFVRDLEVGDATHPAIALTLHDLAGHLLVDLTKYGEYAYEDKQVPPWSGGNIQLHPGLYRLRISLDATDIREQILVTCPGWQTQLFLLRQATADHPGYRANLFDGALFMVPTGTGFDPRRLDFKQTELVRQGLSQRRVVITPDDLEQMYWVETSNPMLGVYGAQLLLLASNLDRPLLHKITAALHRMLGNHPDVAALAGWIGNTEGELLIFNSPPMLRQSWNMIVEASIEQPDIVPANSLSSQIGIYVWEEGAWLIWSVPPPVDATALASSIALELLPMFLPQVYSYLPEPDIEALEQIIAEKQLTILERYLLEYMVDVLNTAERPRYAPPVDRLSPQMLIQVFGIPRAAIENAVATLLGKFIPMNNTAVAQRVMVRLAQIEQLQALKLLSPNPTIDTLQQLVADKLAQSPGAALPIRFDNLQQRANIQTLLRAQIEKNNGFGLTCALLLQSPALHLSDHQRIVALIRPVARAAYQRLGLTPRLLVTSLVSYVQIIAEDPWKPQIPANRRWSIPGLGATSPQPDPDIQHVAMTHAAIVAFLHLDRDARQSALADPDKRLLRQQADRIARQAHLPRQERQRFIDAYLEALQASVQLFDEV